MPRERFRDDSDASVPAAFDDPYCSTTTALGGNVSVVHGCYGHSLPLAGMTVGEARIEVEERMNVDPDAVALLDGNDADEDTIIQEGQVLTFVKHAGEKGNVPRRSHSAAPKSPCRKGALRWPIDWSSRTGR